MRGVQNKRSTRPSVWPSSFLALLLVLNAKKDSISARVTFHRLTLDLRFTRHSFIVQRLDFKPPETVLFDVILILLFAILLSFWAFVETALFLWSPRFAHCLPRRHSGRESADVSGDNSQIFTSSFLQLVAKSLIVLLFLSKFKFKIPHARFTGRRPTSRSFFLSFP